MTAKTNAELAKENDTTSRQIAKSRTRGYITNSAGDRVRFKAPTAAHIVPSKTGEQEKDKKRKKSGPRRDRSESADPNVANY